MGSPRPDFVIRVLSDVVETRREQGDVVGVVGAAGVVDKAVRELVRGRWSDSLRWCARSAMARVASVPGCSTRPSA